MYFYIIYIYDGEFFHLDIGLFYVQTELALYVVYKTWLLVATLSVEVQMYSLASS